MVSMMRDSTQSLGYSVENIEGQHKEFVLNSVGDGSHRFSFSVMV